MICCTALLVFEENYYFYTFLVRGVLIRKKKGDTKIMWYSLLNLNFENDKKALSVKND